MRIRNVIIPPKILEKLERKHSVKENEVREMFANAPKIRYLEEGDVQGENLYLALGRTDAGRYLSAVFIYKWTYDALVISAKDMSRKERRQYGRK
jgi:uncharacterized DUF497 family protein